ncbi:uncharacterized protein [Bos taurus]|uniref:uncharacterized protein n=1 Tax=Bos taurus TaxID=9913 RepID=UPI0028CBA9AD|nr:uncharacterized protein LOC112445176 [Bos taurus]
MLAPPPALRRPRPPAPRPALICWHLRLHFPIDPPALLLLRSPRSPASPRAAARRRPGSSAFLDLFPCLLPLLPSIPVSAFSRLFCFSTSETLRAQGFSDVIFLRCADNRRWRKERFCRPSLLLLGCSFGVMAPSLWKGLVGIGLFALAHAAFSAAQHYFPSSGIKWKRKCEFLQSSSFQDKIFRSMYYVYDRSYMRLTEKEDESLPIDIVLQTLLAFAVTCYGIVSIAGEFKRHGCHFRTKK